MLRRRLFIEWLGRKLSSDDPALRRLELLRGSRQTTALARVPVFLREAQAR